MTRSMGDYEGIVAGVISVPEIANMILTNTSKIFIIASDGVWEYMSNEDVLKVVLPFY